MNVLSLFDGMSCGQQALERAGIEVENYYASEIDKHAITVTMANYPNTVQLGSVIDVDATKLPKIDLLIGGSPCQSFSFAGKRKGMVTKCEQEILTLNQYLELKNQGFEFEGQSYLFWEYVRLFYDLKARNPNILFLLENVIMIDKWKRIISDVLDVAPIEINSSLVSAQNRRRLYWTNIGLDESSFFGSMPTKIQQPKNKGILLKDILETDVDAKYYLSSEVVKRIGRSNNGERCFTTDDKSICLAAGYYKQGRDHQYINTEEEIICHNMQPRSGDPTKGGTGHLTWSDGKSYCLDTGNTNAIETRKILQINDSIESGGKQPYQQNIIYDTDGILPALCAKKSDLLIEESYIAASRGRNTKTESDTEQMLEPRFDGKTNSLTTVQKDNLVVERTVNPLVQARTEEGKEIRRNGGHDGVANKVLVEKESDKMPTLLTGTGKDNLLMETVEYVNIYEEFSYKSDVPIDDTTPKFSTLRANAGGKLSGLGIIDNTSDRLRYIEPIHQGNRLSYEDEKMACLSAQGGNMLRGVGIVQKSRIRRLTPIECERLQTVNDNYTMHVSDSQRYKMLGNGWTVDVIAHIFKYI